MGFYGFLWVFGCSLDNTDIVVSVYTEKLIEVVSTGLAYGY